MECIELAPTLWYKPNEPYTRDIAGCSKRSSPYEVLYNSEIVDNLEANVDTASSPVGPGVWSLRKLSLSDSRRLGFRG